MAQYFFFKIVYCMGLVWVYSAWIPSNVQTPEENGLFSILLYHEKMLTRQTLKLPGSRQSVFQKKTLYQINSNLFYFVSTPKAFY